MTAGSKSADQHWWISYPLEMTKIPERFTWATEIVDVITVDEFSPVSGCYWDTKHAQLVAFAKQGIGAAIGKTLDDSIEGEVRP